MEEKMEQKSRPLPSPQAAAPPPPGARYSGDHSPVRMGRFPRNKAKKSSVGGVRLRLSWLFFLSRPRYLARCLPFGAHARALRRRRRSDTQRTLPLRPPERRSAWGRTKKRGFLSHRR